MSSSNAQRMSLYITSDVTTTGKVEIPGLSFTQNFTITANQITEVQIPQGAILPGEGSYFRGIHVTAEMPVVVYGHIYYNAVSGASLCLPTPTLGREYISVNYTQFSNQAGSYSYFFIVATEDNTTVEIIPAADTRGGRSAGVPFTVQLDKGEIYQVLSERDLTGSSIRSINTGDGCKKIAVFCGSGKIAIGCTSGNASSDNLYQQMSPINTWGKSFITVPSMVRSLNYYRIVKSDPTAEVRLNGAPISPAAFINGLYYEFSSTGTSLIESDKAIMVAQYFTSQQSCIETGVPGDPEMIYLNPLEQTINRVTLYSSPKYNITSHYINIVVKNSGTAVSSMKLDNSPISASFIPLPENPAYSYAQIKVNSGTHNLVSDSGFNAIAYGFGTAESYGYSAGTNLKDLYQYISVTNPEATVDFPSACSNTPFLLSITFPYQPTQVAWDFGGLFPNVVWTSPVYSETFVKDGRNLYVYRITQPYVLSQAGTYNIRVSATNPTPDGCSGIQEIDYELTIHEPPVVDFNVNGNTNCHREIFSFADNSDGRGRPIVKWQWEIGTDATQSDKSFEYHFPQHGKHDVKLRVVSDVGCVSEVLVKEVEVYPDPVADITVTNPLCENSAVQFLSNSTISGGTIKSHHWDFGDGAELVQQTPGTIDHYFSSGTHTVKFFVESDMGCRSDVLERVLNIGKNPVADFVTPEVCLSDPAAVFLNTSTIDDGTGASLIYYWTFGDPNADGNNPNTSSEKDASHKYLATGDYEVTLTVTSNLGCTNQTVKNFRVNGSIPKANFQVLNETSLCSNQNVEITDASTVDFGDIVRVEIYWDYGNDPTNKTIDEDPFPGKKYQHLYPDFGIPASKSFTILYVAYSGINCVSQQIRDVTVNASPLINFAPIPGICFEKPPVTLNQASEIYAFAGTGFYSGNGVNANGVFNPASAGVGVHHLTYQFNASNGCKASANQNIEVFPTPTVNAGPDRYILEGQSEQMSGSGTGTGVGFVWSPAIFLTDVNDPRSIITPVDDTRYTLEATSEHGCKATDEVQIWVLKTPLVPNVFSPNGDGINDTWVIPYLSTYPDCTVEVYNRYGQLVFRSKGYSNPWDGKLKGTDLPVGTYYYIIEPKNGRLPMKGAVSIVR
ncbi:MAG TPA: PKD domain-containing protein [Parasegetibacter sp.]